jgi:signal transduction histidine kinase
MAALLRPLIRARTYRRAVHLLLGAVILLPYMLLTTALARMVAEDAAHRAAVLLIAATAGAIAAVPPFLSGTRELEIAAARALLGVDLPASEHRGPLALETRLRAALWFGVHLAVGAAIGLAVLIAVPMALIVFTERLGLTSGALAGLDVGPLDETDLWWWTVAGVLGLVATVYAVAGLGSLAATMAPVLLGPSPAERMAAVEARERRLAERNRLARELHDSVGHALTATTLQAGAARAVFDRDPDFARRALAAIEEVGRTAMADLDHVLGVLRETGPDEVRRPRTLADLDRLFADVRAGGVELRAEVATATVPATVSEEAYRIVQEGLTNAARHGGPGPVTVRVESAEELTIEVRNPLGGRSARGGGRGVAGMRERVRLLGGTLDVGPVDGHQWRVHARLPIGPDLAGDGDR